MDPYAALRFKEFNIFLGARFAMVFAWAMQFIVIEWQVYSLTKDPLSLGIIGLMEVIPAVSMALFAGHIVDQKEKRNLLIKCLFGFSVISLGYCFKLAGLRRFPSKTIIDGLYMFLSFFGGIVRAFLGPTIFSLLALLVPKKLYPNAATWSSTTWQLASVLGPATAGFSISLIGVHWSMCLIFFCTLIALTAISKFPGNRF